MSAYKKKGRGVFIVIDGIDGSGKATQTKKLVERLAREGHNTKTIDFPRYEENIMGTLIGECLSGARGDFASLDPKIASVLYAADRFESRGKIEQMLDGGAIVVADRYVSANQIHQGGKIAAHKEREAFLAWLDKLEHGVFGLPRPDVTVFLNMDLRYSATLLEKAAKTKTYAMGKNDVVEKDAEYRRRSQESGGYLAKNQKNWIVIESVDGELRSIEDIHEEVYEQVQKYL